MKMSELKNSSTASLLVIEPFYCGSHKQLIDLLISSYGICSFLRQKHPEQDNKTNDKNTTPHAATPQTITKTTVSNTGDN